MAYLMNCLIAVDQLGNALLGGWPDETISARAWRQRAKRRWTLVRIVVDGLFRLLGERDHCEKSAEAESKGLQRPTG